MTAKDLTAEPRNREGYETPIFEALVDELQFDPLVLPPIQTRAERENAHNAWRSMAEAKTKITQTRETAPHFAPAATRNSYLPDVPSQRDPRSIEGTI